MTRTQQERDELYREVNPLGYKIASATDRLTEDQGLRDFLSAPLADGIKSLLFYCNDDTPAAMFHRAVMLSSLVIAASSQPFGCTDHQLTQHRDHKPPWCRTCERTRWGIHKDSLGAAQ